MKGAVYGIEELKLTWVVVMRGWAGVFTMMELEGKLRFASGDKGWLSQDLPAAGCCTSSSMIRGPVADFRFGFFGGDGGGSISNRGAGEEGEYACWNVECCELEVYRD